MQRGTGESGQDGAKGAETAALRHLARRFMSRSELVRRLVRQGFGQADIDAALARCQSWGYIDDGRLAQALGRRASNKHVGTHKLLAWGRTSGIDAEAMQPVAQALRMQEAKLLRDYVLRRFAGQLAASTREPRIRAKIVRHLVGRGFAPALILQVLNEQAGNTCDDGAWDVPPDETQL